MICPSLTDHLVLMCTGLMCVYAADVHVHAADLCVRVWC